MDAVVRLLAVLAPFALVAGLWLGGHPESLPGPVRDVFVADTEGQVYEEALDTIARDYYREVDRGRLLDASLGQAVEALDDRFSHYFSSSAYGDFQEQTEGRFEGVGMTVEAVDRGLRVLTVYDGSPADRGGLEAGDLILQVNGRSIAGRSADDATTRIKGPAGTDVTLTVLSGGRERQVSLKREEVDIPVVRSRMRRVDGRKIAYARLAGFTQGAHGELGQAVRGLLDEGAGAVVLDLRDNGGGLLSEAVLVSSLFLPDGEIVSTRGRNRPERTYRASGDSIPDDVDVVVLVNGHSASASEIVAGALQDRDRATLVGTRTFGKGVFQEVEPLSNGGALDITVGEYFLPSGRNLGGGGVEKGAGLDPDVRALDDPDTRPDEGLRAALREAA